MAQSKALASTTAVMRRIESAFAAVETLAPKQQEFVMTWARGEYLADVTDTPQGDADA